MLCMGRLTKNWNRLSRSSKDNHDHTKHVDSTLYHSVWNQQGLKKSTDFSDRVIWGCLPRLVNHRHRSGDAGKLSRADCLLSPTRIRITRAGPLLSGFVSLSLSSLMVPCKCALALDMQLHPPLLVLRNKRQYQPAADGISCQRWQIKV